MRPNARTALVALALTAAVACEDDSTGQSSPSASAAPDAPAATVLRAEVERERPAPIGDDALAPFVDGQRDFALDLLRRVDADSDNVLFSPFSIHQALALTFAGARGETREAMSRALRTGADDAAFHQACNALERRLEQPPGDRDGEGAAPLFRTANALFTQDDLPVKDAFLETLGRNYGAGVWRVDFAQATEEARASINQWVSDGTEARVPNLLLPGDVDQATRMVLVNAVYFLADWSTPFDASATWEQPFHAPGGDASTAFMHGRMDLAVAETDTALAVEIPYGDETMSLLVVQPKGSLADYTAGFDRAALEGIEDALTYEPVDLALPRFELRARLSLRSVLVAMGMGPAFGEGQEADFSGISEQPLAISRVIHEAWVRVDEKGTEAAAATAVLLDAGAAFEPEPARSVVIDRPFLLLLRHRPTGALLFVGRILDPQG